MATLIGSAMTLSTAAYTKTANLITGRNQYIPKGKILIIAKGSAIGMQLTLNIGGIPLCDDLPIPFIGTTGSITVKDNVVVEQMVAGGSLELYLRNTTVGALTTDYAVYFTPM